MDLQEYANSLMAKQGNTKSKSQTRSASDTSVKSKKQKITKNTTKRKKPKKSTKNQAKSLEEFEDDEDISTTIVNVPKKKLQSNCLTILSCFSKIQPFCT